MLEELAKINTPEAVPAVGEDTPMTETREVETMEFRIERVEKRILDLLEEMDEMRDKIVDLEIELESRPRKVEVSKETKPAIPIPTPTIPSPPQLRRKGRGITPRRRGRNVWLRQFLRLNQHMNMVSPLDRLMRSPIARSPSMRVEPKSSASSEDERDLRRRSR